VSGGTAPRSTLASRALDTECGAFVTLHKDGRLRGCIGYVRALKPLRRTVAEMAIQAALHDPRFPAVTASEVPSLDIEISVLSPLEEVDDVSSIEVGKHGLIVQDGARSGLLLPQVATEQGWDRDTFLDHTCLKAGLPAGSWKREGVTILRFTAEVFGESEPGARS
jgi:AmmeMemoRadiSam system protein A